MSYYSLRRYNPPATVYAASTLIGRHVGLRMEDLSREPTPMQMAPTIADDLVEFRQARSRSSMAESVRAALATQA